MRGGCESSRAGASRARLPGAARARARSKCRGWLPVRTASMRCPAGCASGRSRKSTLSSRPLKSESIFPSRRLTSALSARMRLVGSIFASTCFTSVCNSRGSGAMKSCKSWRTDRTTCDIGLLLLQSGWKAKKDEIARCHDRLRRGSILRTA